MPQQKVAQKADGVACDRAQVEAGHVWAVLEHVLRVREQTHTQARTKTEHEKSTKASNKRRVELRERETDKGRSWGGERREQRQRDAHQTTCGQR